MTDVTGGELLARAVANEGVKFVFGLPCPEIDPFLAALDDNGIRFVPIRHEAAGVHMAEGLYKTTGQVAIVLGNPGPAPQTCFPVWLQHAMKACPYWQSHRNTGLASSIPRRRRLFRGRINLIYSSPQ